VHRRLLFGQSRRSRDLRAADIPVAAPRSALRPDPREAIGGPCLGVCAGRPIVAVYPEGVWYANVTPELLERIVVEHLKDGRVVDEAVFHRLGAGGG
jgi:(2Fe-2S) ferredoxin